ncbi:MAG: acyl-CoA dehydrogenase [Deltaproteobacteria bacterium]|jgi:butyryl-CoA dehydrogenase|nr:acyl-CoA dehydrogenase [Deltaproteobacteria bacterium]
MSFLTEDQILIQKMVREFADKEVAPIAGEIDKKHRFPAETVKRMAELNLFGLTIPEEYEGSGGDNVSYSVAVEELSRVCGTHGVILSAHVSLGASPILKFGNDAQKKKYLPDLASGRKLSAFCLTEPGAGTDAASQQTEAVLKGDKYIVNGSKVFITNGGVADTFIIFAMTDKSKGLKGITAFIVEKKFPGFVVGQLEDKLGICASSTTEIILKNCEVPKENMLGKEGEGFKIAMQTLDGGRIGIASQALGLAQGALEAAITYAKQRVQFGKPISANQGIQWMLADMATRVEAARQITRHAALAKDTKDKYSTEAAMAKLFAAEAAMWVTTQAVQIHGGIGYTKSYPVERLMRDAKITEIYEGTSQVQRMVIAGSILA